MPLLVPPKAKSLRQRRSRLCNNLSRSSSATASCSSAGNGSATLEASLAAITTQDFGARIRTAVPSHEWAKRLVVTHTPPACISFGAHAVRTAHVSAAQPQRELIAFVDAIAMTNAPGPARKDIKGRVHREGCLEGPRSVRMGR